MLNTWFTGLSKIAENVHKTDKFAVGLVTLDLFNREKSNKKNLCTDLWSVLVPAIFYIFPQECP